MEFQVEGRTSPHYFSIHGEVGKKPSNISVQEGGKQQTLYVNTVFLLSLLFVCSSLIVSLLIEHCKVKN